MAQLSADQQLSVTVVDFAVVYDLLGAKSVTPTNVAAGLSESSAIELVTIPNQ